MKKLLLLITLLLKVAFAINAQTSNHTLHFDGVNDLVDCGVPAYADFSSKDTFTLEVWVKPDGNHYGRIWSYFPQSGDNTFALQLSLASSGKVVFNTSQVIGGPNAPAANLESNKPITLNDWHHIAAVYTNGLLELYVDGQFDGELPYTGPFAASGTTNKLWLGFIPYDPNERFSGLMDEMRISNIARYTSGFIPPCPDFALDESTIGLWHFNEGTDTVAADASGNGNHGAITGAEWVTGTICINTCRDTVVIYDTVRITIHDTIPAICDTVLADSFVMDFNAAFDYTTLATKVSEDYLLSVSGTYGIAHQHGADAAYRFLQNGSQENPPVPYQPWTWNGGTVRPSSDVYNPDHHYTYTFTGNGSSQIFTFTDGGGYGDNSGKLLFKMYHITNCQTVYDTVTIYDTTHVTVRDTVTVYDSIAVTDTLIIYVSLSSEPAAGKHTIKVYPNPAKDILFIHIGNYSRMSGYSIKIINSMGQEIFNSPVDQQEFPIDISSFGSAGIYFIQIIDPDDQIIDTRKIVIE